MMWCEGSGTLAKVYEPIYDGLGNVIAVLDTLQSHLIAEYEYDPYGNLVRASGYEKNGSTWEQVGGDPLANPFRYQTKCLLDAAISPWTETDYYAGYQQFDIYDYGLRWYHARHGRFINRDPIGELGGTNLYAFVGNNPVGRRDVLGMDWQFGSGMGPRVADRWIYDNAGGWSGIHSFGLENDDDLEELPPVTFYGRMIAECPAGSVEIGYVGAGDSLRRVCLVIANSGRGPIIVSDGGGSGGELGPARDAPGEKRNDKGLDCESMRKRLAELATYLQRNAIRIAGHRSDLEYASSLYQDAITNNNISGLETAVSVIWAGASLTTALSKNTVGAVSVLGAGRSTLGSPTTIPLAISNGSRVVGINSPQFSVVASDAARTRAISAASIAATNSTIDLATTANNSYGWVESLQRFVDPAGRLALEQIATASWIEQMASSALNASLADHTRYSGEARALKEEIEKRCP